MPDIRTAFGPADQMVRRLTLTNRQVSSCNAPELALPVGSAATRETRGGGWPNNAQRREWRPAAWLPPPLIAMYRRRRPNCQHRQRSWHYLTPSSERFRVDTVEHRVDARVERHHGRLERRPDLTAFDERLTVRRARRSRLPDSDPLPARPRPPNGHRSWSPGWSSVSSLTKQADVKFVDNPTQPSSPAWRVNQCSAAVCCSTSGRCRRPGTVADVNG
jgi:hypothetical protein